MFSHHRQDAQGKQSEAGWPYLGYDHETRKKELLTRLQQACPGVEFLPATAYNPDYARKILQDDAAVDGYVAQRKEVIFHQGVSVANVDEPRVCRTKLAAEVRGDIEKLMNYWDQWGWHRVTVYGDLKEPIRQVAQSLGMTMVEEA